MRLRGGGKGEWGGGRGGREGGRREREKKKGSHVRQRFADSNHLILRIRILTEQVENNTWPIPLITGVTS